MQKPWGRTEDCEPLGMVHNNQVVNYGVPKKRNLVAMPTATKVELTDSFTVLKQISISIFQVYSD